MGIIYRSMKPPAGYRKLPAGVRCRCPNLWRDGDDHYCCDPPSRSESNKVKPTEHTADGAGALRVGERSAESDPRPGREIPGTHSADRDAALDRWRHELRKDRAFE